MTALRLRADAHAWSLRQGLSVPASFSDSVPLGKPTCKRQLHIRLLLKPSFLMPGAYLKFPQLHPSGFLF